MNIYEKMLIEFFGTTSNIEEAGYVLKDGTLIDLSGRHFVSDPIARQYRGTNMIQHHDIFGKNYKGFSIEDIWFAMSNQHDFQPVLDILKKTQAISLKSAGRCDCYIRMVAPPTAAQYDVIFKYFEEGRANISYIDFDGFIIDDISIAFLTRRKLYDFVNSCIHKKPSTTHFSGAYCFGKGVVCSPCHDDHSGYLRHIDLSKNLQLKKRQEAYQDIENIRHQNHLVFKSRG